jgi:hypothetical protein
MMKSKTTIWQERNMGKTLIETISGLPFGTPNFGQTFSIPKYGMVKCSGVSKSGTGSNEVITEIQLTVQ